jgi:3-hydroxyacyl-[acyl-carrier-protein] dehydratase
MLQSCVEAAAWLWRATTDYRHPVIVLRELKLVKYGTFMLPGHRLDVSVELTRRTTRPAPRRSRPRAPTTPANRR